MQSKQVYYISQLVRALRLVNSAGRISPYGPQNLKGLESIYYGGGFINTLKISRLMP